jgi:hypothetical protein
MLLVTVMQIPAMVGAQDADPEATIAALQTQVAELQSVGATPTPAVTSEASAPEELGQVNLQLILDVSGSMAQMLPSGETRMDAAKHVLQDVIAGIPDREGIDVGLRVYGHEGNNTQEGAAVSCLSSELVVPLAGVNKDALNQAVVQLQPTGWTPIGLSLERAGDDFANVEAATLNYIVLVTDGLETCGGDPVQVAADLRQGPSAVTTSVVGFALTPDEQATVAQIAEAGGGDVLGAADAAQLSEALFAVLSTPVPDIVTPEPIVTSAEFGNWTLTVTGAERTPSIDALFQTFAARGTYVVVSLNVMNTSNTPQSFPYNELVLLDASGRSFSIDADPTIPFQIETYSVAMYDELQPSLAYETAVVFDVPVDATGLRLEAEGQPWQIPIAVEMGT